MFTDIDFMNKYLELIQSINIKSSIEIGAYDADFSLAMSNIIDPKMVWAIEANPEIYLMFDKKLNKINYVNLAISDISGYININKIIEVSETTENYWYAAASSILSRKNPNSVVALKTKSKTLDEFVIDNKISGPIALWIDCEGANKEVLLSAQESLNDVACIYIEVELEEVWDGQWLMQDVIDFLNQNKFIVAYESQGNSLQKDLIFIKDVL